MIIVAQLYGARGTGSSLLWCTSFTRHNRRLVAGERSIRLELERENENLNLLYPEYMYARIPGITRLIISKKSPCYVKPCCSRCIYLCFN